MTNGSQPTGKLEWPAIATRRSAAYLLHQTIASYRFFGPSHGGCKHVQASNVFWGCRFYPCNSSDGPAEVAPLALPKRTLADQMIQYSLIFNTPRWNPKKNIDPKLQTKVAKGELNMREKYYSRVSVIWALGCPEVLLACILLLHFSTNVEIGTQAFTETIPFTECFLKLPSHQSSKCGLTTPVTFLACEAYQCVELFAGKAWVSRSFRQQGYATASLDVLMGQPREGKLDAMDLRTSAGMAFLAMNIVA